MGGLITDEQRDRRIVNALSFIYFFRYVTVKDLNLFGSTFLEVSNMRRTIEHLVKHKMIKNFDIPSPIKTVGYYILDGGMDRLSAVKSPLLDYKYEFWPTRYKPTTYWHETGVRETCLWLKMAYNKGYWLTEWMLRQRRVKASGNNGKKLAWRKKGVYGGRLPDGLFVVGKKARIAIEYESNSKNYQDWIHMIDDLQYAMNEKKKLDLDTLDMVFKKDFEAVLFVFSDTNMFCSYLKRFDEYSKTMKLGNLERNLVRSEKASRDRFFFATLEHLKGGVIYKAGGGETTFDELCQFVEKDALVIEERNKAYERV